MKTLLFDTETTGLSKNSVVRLEKQPHIIELFGISLLQSRPGGLQGNYCFEEIAVWQSLFSHHMKLSEEIVRITGITDDLIKDAPAFRTKAAELKDFIESHDRVVGHNLTFDMDRVDQEMHRAGLSVIWPAERMCTVEETEFVKGYRLSLTALHEHLFGEPFKNAHRAEGDVRAMLKCYTALIERGVLV